MAVEEGLLLLPSTENQNEDWDNSIRGPQSVESSQETAEKADSQSSQLVDVRKRTLSELLKLHAEKGKDIDMSADEASAVAEVLGRWINAESSPFEGEDNFFSPAHSQDDSALLPRRSPAVSPFEGRPRGQSESIQGYQS